MLAAGQTAQVGIGINFFLSGSTVQEILNPLVGGIPDLIDLAGQQNLAMIEHGDAISDLESAVELDRKSTRLNSSHVVTSRMPSSA